MSELAHIAVIKTVKHLWFELKEYKVCWNHYHNTTATQYCLVHLHGFQLYILFLFSSLISNSKYLHLKLHQFFNAGNSCQKQRLRAHPNQHSCT